MHLQGIVTNKHNIIADDCRFIITLLGETGGWKKFVKHNKIGGEFVLNIYGTNELKKRFFCDKIRIMQQKEKCIIFCFGRDFI